MGNHFRTSGAGDDAPKTQPGAVGTRFAAPDSEDQLFSPNPAQPADQAQQAIPGVFSSENLPCSCSEESEKANRKDVAQDGNDCCGSQGCADSPNR